VTSIILSAVLVAASPGSLYDPTGRLADASRDFRASQVGDVVTILVSDRASAVAKGVTNSARKSAAKAGAKSIAGISNSRLTGLADISGDQSLQGTGQTSRDLTLSTTVSAVVTAVDSNGNLTVEGKKDIVINAEKQTVTLHGNIRPVDLTVSNTVRSDQIAALTIQINGKGVVGDAIRRPNILYRLLLGVLPF